LKWFSFEAIKMYLTGTSTNYPSLSLTGTETILTVNILTLHLNSTIVYHDTGLFIPLGFTSFTVTGTSNAIDVGQTISQTSLKHIEVFGWTANKVYLTSVPANFELELHLSKKLCSKHQIPGKWICV
jgi:hypothetical protein